MAAPGFNWIIPGVDRMILVNITEIMVNAKPQEILEAEGEAQAIQLVNEAADKFFVGNAQLLKSDSLRRHSRLDPSTSPVWSSG